MDENKKNDITKKSLEADVTNIAGFLNFTKQLPEPGDMQIVIPFMDENRQQREVKYMPSPDTCTKIMDVLGEALSDFQDMLKDVNVDIKALADAEESVE